MARTDKKNQIVQQKKKNENHEQIETLIFIPSPAVRQYQAAASGNRLIIYNKLVIFQDIHILKGSFFTYIGGDCLHNFRVNFIYFH